MQKQCANYESTMDWIYSVPRFSRQPHLDRFKELLRRLNNPHNNAKFVHVAGTNGKGSVAAMVGSILREAGFRTGVYTSPHLEEFCERISVDAQNIPRDSLAALAQEVSAVCNAMLSDGYEHPIQFEIITAIGFLYFEQQQCDYVSLEVGLGGRFDATNVVRPEVCCITTISPDHTEVLGSTPEEIAYEKAGIMKRGSPVVTGVQERRALSVIERRARELGSTLVRVGNTESSEVRWRESRYSLEGQKIDVLGAQFTYADLWIPLAGRHQQLNASVAVSAVQFLEDMPHKPLEQAVRDGIAQVRWPGRLEVMHTQPLVIVDGAHNIEGIQALAQEMLDHSRGNLLTVYGLLQDKAASQVTEIIAKISDIMLITKPHNPRAVEPSNLVEQAAQYTRCEAHEHIPDAIDRALSLAAAGDTVLCCGSLYLAGPARTYLKTKWPESAAV